MLSKDAKWGWEIVDAQGRVVWRFDADGAGTPNLTLRDAPAPKASGTDWIVRFAERGRPYAMAFATHDEAKKWLSERSGIWQEVAIIRVPWTEGMGVEAEGGE